MRVTSLNCCFFPRNRNKNKTPPIFMDCIHDISAPSVISKLLIHGISPPHADQVRHTVSTSIAQIVPFLYCGVYSKCLWSSFQWSLSARFDTFGSSALYSLIGSDGGTEIRPSDSALIKDPRDKLPLFGGMSTNREHWPALDHRVC